MLPFADTAKINYFNLGAICSKTYSTAKRRLEGFGKTDGWRMQEDALSPSAGRLQATTSKCSVTMPPTHL